MVGAKNGLYDYLDLSCISPDELTKNAALCWSGPLKIAALTVDGLTVISNLP